MPVELQLLVWSAVLALVQMLVALFAAQSQLGLSALTGNREGIPSLSGWGGRAARAHANMLENLVIFAVLVLDAQATGQLNGTTRLGAGIFFWARLAYAFVYVIGIPWVRTLTWLVSLAGILLILSQLI